MGHGTVRLATLEPHIPSSFSHRVLADIGHMQHFAQGFKSTSAKVPIILSSEGQCGALGSGSISLAWEWHSDAQSLQLPSDLLQHLCVLGQVHVQLLGKSTSFSCRLLWHWGWGGHRWSQAPVQPCSHPQQPSFLSHRGFQLAVTQRWQPAQTAPPAPDCRGHSPRNEAFLLGDSGRLCFSDGILTDAQELESGLQSGLLPSIWVW